MPYGYRGLKIFTSLPLRFQDFQRPPKQSESVHQAPPQTALSEQQEAVEGAASVQDETQEPQGVSHPIETSHQGQLILDATVVEQAIRFPTDLSLLNEAREFSEKIIDTLCANLKRDKKPRTYREKARQAYLAIAKQKRPGGKVLRRGIKQQLQ